MRDQATTAKEVKMEAERVTKEVREKEKVSLISFLGTEKQLERL